MTTTTTSATWNDAGLLREFAADRYGDVYALGLASSVRYRLAMNMAIRLAWLTNTDVEQVIMDLAGDYNGLQYA